MDLEHPAITRVNRTGYPVPVKRPKASFLWGIDAFNREIFFNDEILMLPNGDYILVKGLSDKAIRQAVSIGAVLAVAE